MKARRPLSAIAAKDVLRAEDVAFLLCIEANQLEPQGLLLCESIRMFGGRYADAEIIAVSPRPELGLAESARARLRDLNVTYVVEPLNTTGHTYGTINRVVAGAWAEAAVDSRHLIVLDTDTVFVAEPAFYNVDVGIRPVDAKGSASAGADDPLDLYWARMCSLGGIALDDLPMLRTTATQQLIRASYNGGFTVVRRALNILSKTQEIFFRAFSEGLRPLPGTKANVKASTGFVGTEATEWWGSSQAALSVAIWSTTRDVQLYGPNYNIPLHLRADPRQERPLGEDSPAILIHYHYLAEPSKRTDFLTRLACAGCRPHAIDWIRSRLAMFDK